MVRCVGSASPWAAGAIARARVDLAAMSSPVAVRRATPADVPGIAGAMLARAFYDDPVAAWAFPSDAQRAAALERFQATRAATADG